jgi:hypothetical protein
LHEEVKPDVTAVKMIIMITPAAPSFPSGHGPLGLRHQEFRKRVCNLGQRPGVDRDLLRERGPLILLPASSAGAVITSFVLSFLFHEFAAKLLDDLED